MLAGSIEVVPGADVPACIHGAPEGDASHIFQVRSSRASANVVRPNSHCGLGRGDGDDPRSNLTPQGPGSL